MRTRMYGGVRGRGLAAPSYSIFEIQYINLDARSRSPEQASVIFLLYML
jgi:hypothetical protein